MKLQVLAAAVAASLAFPMAALADNHEGLKVSGDITVAYDSVSESIDENGSEINFDGMSEVNGVTYMGHAELDFQGNGNSPEIQEARVGAKGGFGEVWLGEVDNACDQYDPDDPDVWNGIGTSCKGSDRNSVLYKNQMGAAEFAVSHNPGADESAIGARFGAGPVKVNLGYEDGVGSDDDLISYGVAGSFGDVAVSAEGNDDDDWAVHASYSANNTTVWGAVANSSDVDQWAVGYKMSHGKMDYIIEHKDLDTSDQTLAGLRYNF
jgi:hypothetical protein